MSFSRRNSRHRRGDSGIFVDASLNDWTSSSRSLDNVHTDGGSSTNVPDNGSTFCFEEMKLQAPTFSPRILLKSSSTSSIPPSSHEEEKMIHDVENAVPVPSSPFPFIQPLTNRQTRRIEPRAEMVHMMMSQDEQQLEEEDEEGTTITSIHIDDENPAMDTLIVAKQSSSIFTAESQSITSDKLPNLMRVVDDSIDQQQEDEGQDSGNDQWSHDTLIATNSEISRTPSFLHSGIDIKGQDQEKDAFDFESTPTVWQRAKDPKTGLTYYFNESTGDCQWERPKNFTDSAIDQTTAKNIDDAIAKAFLSANHQCPTRHSITKKDRKHLNYKTFHFKNQIDDSCYTQELEVVPLDDIEFISNRQGRANTDSSAPTSYTMLKSSPIARPELIKRNKSDYGTSNKRCSLPNTHGMHTVSARSQRDLQQKKDEFERTMIECACIWIQKNITSTTKKGKKRSAKNYPSLVSPKVVFDFDVSFENVAEEDDLSIESTSSLEKEEGCLDERTMSEMPSLHDIIAQFESIYYSCTSSKQEYHSDVMDRDMTPTSKIIVISLIYLQRMVGSTQEGTVLTDENWKSLVASCIRLGYQVWCSDNSSDSRLESDEEEKILLKAMDNNMKVKASDYIGMCFLIRSMLTETQIRRGDLSLRTNGILDGISDLEERSMRCHTSKASTMLS